MQTSLCLRGDEGEGEGVNQSSVLLVNRLREGRGCLGERKRWREGENSKATGRL